MQTVRSGVILGVLSQAVVLVSLALEGTLTAAGLVIGAACGLLASLGLGAALTWDGADGPRPADWVTLTRAILVGGIAALVATSFARAIPVETLVSLTAAALALDAVDGAVARRTRTANAVGARFDMEVDAFLILTLAVYDVRWVGGFVLLSGVARYGLAAAAWVWPWLRAAAPFRYWNKVVAAVQGVALGVVATGGLPHWAAVLVAGIALVLLAESFGRQIWWLARHRPRAGAVRRSVPRRVVSALLTVVAFALVWFALLAPNRLDQLSPTDWLRLPLEGIVLALVVLVLPARAGRWVAVVVGVLLAAVLLVAVLDVGFFEALDRPFDPVSDWSYLGPAFGVLADSIGRGTAVLVAVLGGLVLLGVLTAVPLSTRRLARLISGRRGTAARFVGASIVIWVVAAMVGASVAPGLPVASADSAALVGAQVGAVRSGLSDQKTFAAQISHDPEGITPGADLLTALRGKDVLIVFVESYGRVAVQGTGFSAGVDTVLRAGTASLAAGGFRAESGFLTSPTFGGISWLAHSTLQSGLWINSQLRYNELVESDRFTLSDAFGRAGWDTVSDIPSNFQDWPEGSSFYHYDTQLDGRNVGYHGPSFSYASMPDQYTLADFQREVLADPGRRPVMAEIDLVSSHTPWAPLPSLVDWNSVGNGSVFAPQPAAGANPTQVWKSATGVQQAYGQSIQYSLSALISFIQHYPDPNLVMVMLGDHQPAAVVSGTNPGHDVPISLIAHDPAVLDHIAGWNWQPGLLPSPTAPVWSMDTFRDRFLTAFA